MEAIGRLYAELSKQPGLALVRGLDLSEAGSLDTAGAWLIHKLRSGGRLPVIGRDQGKSREQAQKRTGPSPASGESSDEALPVINADPEQEALLELVAQSPGDPETAPGQAEVESAGRPGLLRLPLLPVNFLGEAMFRLYGAFTERLNFFGAFVSAMGKNLLRPASFRLTSMVYHMEQAGVKAVPIVALLAFLIGTVLAYMTAGQLANFGAELFVVKLLEVGVLREMGVLITAILVAGRSGSSFTAQIGSMLANQEIDAMRSMGMDPMIFLVVPRMLALMIMLPALVLLADLAGMFGGLCAVWLSLDITPQVFIQTLHEGINFDNVLVGLAKAPFFALVIGGIGCFTGFKAGNSADSVGRMTTKAVVESIFLVITLDALFALFFSKIGF